MKSLPAYKCELKPTAQRPRDMRRFSGTATLFPAKKARAALLAILVLASGQAQAQCPTRLASVEPDPSVQLARGLAGSLMEDLPNDTKRPAQMLSGSVGGATTVHSLLLLGGANPVLGVIGGLAYGIWAATTLSDHYDEQDYVALEAYSQWRDCMISESYSTIVAGRPAPPLSQQVLKSYAIKMDELPGVQEKNITPESSEQDIVARINEAREAMLSLRRTPEAQHWTVPPNYGDIPVLQHYDLGQ